MSNKILKWSNYTWGDQMEGGRIIHPDEPYNWLSNSDDVVTVMRNGEMHLTFRKNPKKIDFWDGKTYEPSIERALLRTKDHFDYGSFSLEMIMPKGLNVGCAFWLSGAGNWPPEIDILEAWATNCNYLHCFTNHFPWLGKSWRTTYNVHYRDLKGVHRHFGSNNIRCKHQPLDPTENWIKYECDWLPDEIVFRANGVTTKVVKRKYAHWLVDNLIAPEKGHLMDAIIDIQMSDPAKENIRLDTPLKVRNFQYEEY